MMSSPDVCTFLGSGDSVRGANRDIGVALSSRFAPRTENIGNAAATFQRWNRVIAKALLIVFVCSIAWLFSADSAKSQIIDWTNSSGTPAPWLHDPGNWNGGVLPGTTDTARFQLPGTYNVWWDSTTSAAVPDVGMVQVLDGQLIFLNQDAAPQHDFFVRGTSGGGLTSDFQVSGPTTLFTIRGMHVRNYGGAEITNFGNLTVDGSHSAGSQFSVNDVAGFNVDGFSTVATGGIISSTSSRLANGVGSGTNVLVTGNGSQWNNSNTLSVGENGAAYVLINNGGTVSGNTTYIGENTGSLGDVTVNGVGSQLNSSGNMAVGWMGDAQGNLLVEAGGVVTNANGYLGGAGSAAIGTATITGAGSTWYNSNLYLGTNTGTNDSGVGTIELTSGGRLVVGDDLPSQFTDPVIVSDYGNDGNLFLRNGSQIQSQSGRIAVSNSTFGKVVVNGNGTKWNNSGGMYIGTYGFATLDIESGGNVTNDVGQIGIQSSGSGIVNVSGIDSCWQNSQALYVGVFGEGHLSITDGGTVLAGSMILGSGNSNGFGTVVVTDDGSSLRLSGDLSVGNPNSGNSSIINASTNGLVSVLGQTSISQVSSVYLGGGRFEFGTTDADSYSRISGPSGELAGVVSLSGYNPINTLDLSIANLDTTEVRHGNSGVIHGGGYSAHALVNQANGEVRTQSSEWIRFGGGGNTNAGEFNNFGGTIEFENDLTNQISGFISGRGLYIANGGWANNGVMAFSGGFTDIHGDLANSSTGQIAIGGGSVTTFNDDVTMDAANMNVDIAENSVAVFFGSYNGGSTGLGSVHAFGDLRPGNSPAVVSFGGDLELAASTLTSIELAGTDLGEFDQLDVDGSLSLNGVLEVSMIDGFTLGWNQQFVIADVDGTLFGQFLNLQEGDLVGNYGGHDLYISYGAGDGNDVGLFTAVPEPASFVLLNAGWLALLLTRRRRSNSICGQS